MRLVYLTCAWLLGIFLCAWLSPSWAALALLSLPVLAGLALWWREPPARRRWVLGVTLLLGACRYAAWQPSIDASRIAYYNGSSHVTLTGIVTSDPDVRDKYTQLRVRASSLDVNGVAHEVRGTVLIQAPRYPYYSYGDEIQAIGALETPSEGSGFSYRAYLARQGIYASMSYPALEVIRHGQGSFFYRAIYAFRARAMKTLSTAMPEPEASLLSGILLGIQSTIPEDVMDAFTATGTVHIIVISGFNLTLLAGLLIRLGARFLHRYNVLLAAMASIVVYALFVGASAPVLRAAAMVSLALLAYLVGRPYHAGNAVAAAVLGMTLLNPASLWDVSLQLSLAATVGLLFLTPLLSKPLEGQLADQPPDSNAAQALKLLKDLLLTSIAATLATLPIILYYFQRLSLISLLTNVLILPIQPLIMYSGGTAALAGIIWLPMGRALSWLPWLFLAYTTRVVEWTARVPWATVELSISGWAVAAYYVALIGIPLAVRYRLEIRDRVGKARRIVARGTAGQEPSLHPGTLGLVGTLGVTCALIWVAAVDVPDGLLHVRFLDVGQGDAILITLPQGQQILVDGGPEPSRLLDGLGRAMPFWDRTLDLVVLTHGDMDHLGGLPPVLERYKVGYLLYSPAQLGQSAAADYWRELVAKSAATQIVGTAGTILAWGDYARLEILHPDAALLPGTKDGTDNDNSVVLRLEYGETSLLLTGDIGAAAEEHLLRDGVDLACQVLKVSHHGAGESSSAAFLRSVHPALAVISVGVKNRFGHPAPETLQRLQDSGAQIMRTDQQGAIEVLSDGRQLWVQAEAR